MIMSFEFADGRGGFGGREHQLQRFYAIVEHMPIFIRVSDRDGNATYLNKLGRKWKGISDEEHIEQSEVPRMDADVMRVAAEQGIWQRETRFTRKDVQDKIARKVWQIVKAHKGPDGDVEFFSTMAIERTRQTDLEQVRLHLQSIIEDTPEFVAAADADGNIVYFNRAARSMLGIGPDDDVEGFQVKDVHPEWATRFLAVEGFPAAARDGQWEGETAVITRDGREIPVLQALVAHKSADGEVQHYSTIIRDISELKELEQQLHYQATHDALTGAMNRAHFEEYLDREIALAQTLDNTGRSYTLTWTSLRKLTILLVTMSETKCYATSCGFYRGA